jgi:nucleoside-diphosphate-sugar epimerase
MAKVKVLLTGACGRIGPTLVGAFKARYDLRLFDRESGPDDVEGIVGDIADFEAVKSAMEGVDVVVHMAAKADEAPFDELLQPNIVGVHNVFEAAVAAGVRRVVFASSCHATGGYPWEETISADAAPRPGTVYGATKAFGEALGWLYHRRHGIEFLCIRIGWFLPYDHPYLRKNRGARRLWLSPRDCVQLFTRAIETPDIGAAIVNGTSNPDGGVRMELDSAREILGYRPEECAFELFGPVEGEKAYKQPDFGAKRRMKDEG